MYYVTKKGFSLIEVIIATTILSISVFGVYKLISENTKIINNSSSNIQLTYLLPLLKECITNIGFSNYTLIVGKEYNFNLGNNNNTCNIGTVSKIKIDNVDYEIKGLIKDFGLNYINWELYINNGEEKILTGAYTLNK